MSSLSCQGWELAAHCQSPQVKCPWHPGSHSMVTGWTGTHKISVLDSVAVFLFSIGCLWIWSWFGFSLISELLQGCLHGESAAPERLSGSSALSSLPTVLSLPLQFFPPDTESLDWIQLFFTPSLQPDQDLWVDNCLKVRPQSIICVWVWHSQWPLGLKQNEKCDFCGAKQGNVIQLG